ncbi:deoxyguanosinetriphosphate triphosphohydrolase [candidate division GN15 bacterium]|uniref:Deoxyguanosinetriphosphate triphosphohydrolase-like protein n=1 Tax=candidate division GN15 bacterium TaxID=2072418 RepID=A0A855X7L2_9BACT|nr:MAG: deoxyguanosinetriphosphate triphosphohydrolase [candidate division GN15 bacterium]
MVLDNREAIERREAAILAPYAAHAARTLGRTYPQTEHPFRTAFQRDRDRVIHSTAFRRMEFKTQVFLPHEGDHFRTRLTHTIEVAQISRTLARALRLNEDLAEAIALVHDLGHTPFGHAGEDVLHDLLRECGGFNHNNQSLRVVDYLEQRYSEHPGLNLTFEVREGIAKHETKTKIIRPEFAAHVFPTLEASLVDLADEIAYNAHDVDDGLRAKMITLDDLKTLSIVKGSGVWGQGSGATKPISDEGKQNDLVRYLVNTMATDVLMETSRRIESLLITELEDVYQSSERLCGYSTDIAEQVQELKSFLRQRIYRHERLLAMTRRAREIIETLFARFDKFPEKMPKRYQAMLQSERKELVIADYIAGMTDRYAERLLEST